MNYFQKMKGTSKSPPGMGLAEIAWSWVGAFLGIAAIALLSDYVLAGIGLTLMIGSFGASALLLYGAIRSPFAQPRNLLGGHVLSAVIGVTCYKLFHGEIWLASSLAVATAIAVMHATKTLHPPGGATALIAVIGGAKIYDLGYLYVLIPVGSGALIMLMIALLVNNLSRHRRYPEFWF